MKARFIQEIGTRAFLRVYWGDDCPNCYGSGRTGCHNAQILLMDSDKLEDWKVGGNPDDYPDERWPVKCDHCGAPVSADAIRQVFNKRLYNTSSGNPEPGDLFWAPWYHHPDYKRACCKWDNCNDPRGHLMAVLPNGHQWDIDSRASNCTMKEDRTHRCWVKHGEPPDIHVDKNGHTCQAGAGSIAVEGYHGFLHNGEFTSC